MNEFFSPRCREKRPNGRQPEDRYEVTDRRGAVSVRGRCEKHGETSDRGRERGGEKGVGGLWLSHNSS